MTCISVNVYGELMLTLSTKYSITLKLSDVHGHEAAVCDPAESLCCRLISVYLALCTSRAFIFCSSLQGKFIRINFDVTGYIVGANIETCILF